MNGKPGKPGNPENLTKRADALRRKARRCANSAFCSEGPLAAVLLTISNEAQHQANRLEMRARRAVAN